MPRRVQAKKAHRYQPQAKAPHKKAPIHTTRESRKIQPEGKKVVSV